MGTPTGDRPPSTDSIVSATLRGVEPMGGRRVLAEPTVGKDGLMDRVQDEIPDTPPKIVGKLLTISGEDDVALRMPAQIPSREDPAGNQALAVTRWLENHQTRYLATLNSLEPGYDQFMMLRPLKLWPLSYGVTRKIFTGQG